MDLTILHISAEWEKYNREVGDDPVKKANWKAQNHGKSDTDLQALMERAKQKHANKEGQNNT